MAKRKSPARKPTGRTKSGAPRKRAAPTGNWKRHTGPYRRKNGTRVKGYSKQPTGCSLMLAAIGVAAVLRV